MPGVVGGDRDAAAALRLVRPDVDLEAVPVEGGIAVVAHRRRQEVVLDVGPLEPGTRADEGAGLEVVGGAEAALEEDPAGADQALADGPQLRVEGDRLGAAELEVDLDVILQVGADPRQVVHHLDAGGAQHLGRPDARELQQHGRADRAGAQDHLAPGARLGEPAAGGLVGDPHRLAALEQYLVGQCAGDDLEVGPSAGRVEVGLGGRPADAVLDGHVHGAEAFLLPAVVVPSDRVAGLFAGLDEGLVERVQAHVVAGAGGERPLAAAVFVAAALPGLGPAEVGQAVAVAPAGRALGLPFVEVAGVAAHVDHAVDRGGAAQHLAARAVQAAAVQIGLRLGLEEPVEALHVHGDGERRGHLHEDVPVAAAGLQQQHPALPVRGQPVGQHATGRAGSHDDVVVVRHDAPPFGPETCSA